MLQKQEVQLRAQHPNTVSSHKLTSAEKGLLRLAAIDDDDKVLHVSCGRGSLLSILSQMKRCHLCGTTDDITQMRHARTSLPGADIVYAQAEDIPWHNDTFSVLLCSMPFFELADPGRMLQEALRVLKPGGELLLSIPWYPAPLRQLVNYISSQSDMENAPTCYGKQEMIAALEAMGFESVTWHTQDLSTAVIAGWKPKVTAS